MKVAVKKPKKKNDALEKERHALQAHHTTEGNVDRARKYLEMKNMFGDQLETGQNWEDMVSA